MFGKIFNQKDLGPLLLILIKVTIVLLGIGAVMLALFGIQWLWPTVSFILNGISAFIIGFIIAFLAHPAVVFLQKRICFNNRGAAIFLFIVLLVASLVFLVLPLIPQIYEQIIMLKDAIFNLLSYLQETFKIDLFGELATFWQKNVDSFVNYLKESPNQALSAVNSIAGWSIAAMMTIIAALFFLFDFENLLGRISGTLPYRRRESFTKYFTGLSKEIYAYFKALVLSTVISSIVFAIVLFANGVQNALPLAIVMNLFNFIPIIGSFITTVLLGLVTVPVSLQLTLFAFLPLTIFMQIFINAIAPRIYARAISVPNILVILAILAGGNILGFVGILMAIPILVIILYTMRYIKVRMWRRVRKQAEVLRQRKHDILVFENDRTIL
ncbi:AI-2E family transporter [Culicoidibacter larvae]|nr:AI-2E family transporter [Culicoidibacter larvae]